MNTTPSSQRPARLSLAQAALLLRVDERRKYNWKLQARPLFARPDGRYGGQMPPPGNWRYWIVMAGRGYGKSRMGAEQVRLWARDYSLVSLIGATASDARDIMIEGESGILAICPERERPEYQPSKSRLVWPNGSRSLIFTADEPERLRGKQHMKLWADELGSWRYPEAWDQAMFGLRLGDNPQAIVTMTPKPTRAVRELLKHPAAVVTVGTTYENRDNLAGAFYSDIISKYEGTRLGRQELNAEILDDVPGALWNRAMLEDCRIGDAEVPGLKRVVVAVDPSVSSSEGANEAGIVVAGVDHAGIGYILADISLKASPDGWASEAVKAYRDWQADRIIGESNNGGDMVELTVRTVDRNVPVRLVRASRGKTKRAEPVAALYEQHKVHHVGMFAELEDQLCTKTEDSDNVPDDRYDALVWAITDLMLATRQREDFGSYQG